MIKKTFSLLTIITLFPLSSYALSTSSEDIAIGPGDCSASFTCPDGTELTCFGKAGHQAATCSSGVDKRGYGFVSCTDGPPDSDSRPPPTKTIKCKTAGGIAIDSEEPEVKF